MPALTFITMSRTPEDVCEIKDALAGSSLQRVLAACNNPDQLLADILRLRPSAAVIVLSAQNPEPDFALIKKLVAANPSTAIISAARDASPNMILGSLRAGARDFLQLPIIPQELRTVLERTSEFCIAEESTAQNRGRLVAVFAGKGGSGVSFLGTNLAAALNVQTLVVDLNLQAGDAASFLGLATKYSLADVVLNRDRLDDSLINSFVTPHSSNLSLLAAPTEAHEAEDIRPQDITEILHLLSQRFDCIVLDLPHTFDPVTVAALDMADEILLLMTLDIPGIRSTKRALNVFDRLGYPRRKVHVVVNRWSKNIEVELQKVESHLNEQLIGFVPNDYRKVMDSINLGRPLVQTDPTSKITTEIKRIAEFIGAGNHATLPQPRKKLLRSMFGRQTPSTVMELSTLPDTP